MLFRDDMKAIADKARAKVFASCRERVDVVVSTDPAHVGYLSGYRSVLLDADRAYRCAVIITRDRTILVTGASDAAPALEVVRDPSCIYRYGVFYFSGRGSSMADLVGDAEGKRHICRGAARGVAGKRAARSCHRRGRC